eukprot:6812533-Lingulodinium_polyedra.AAC.1
MEVATRLPRSNVKSKVWLTIWPFCLDQNSSTTTFEALGSLMNSVAFSTISGGTVGDDAVL